LISPNVFGFSEAQKHKDLYSELRHVSALMCWFPVVVVYFSHHDIFLGSGLEQTSRMARLSLSCIIILSFKSSDGVISPTNDVSL